MAPASRRCNAAVAADGFVPAAAPLATRAAGQPARRQTRAASWGTCADRPSPPQPRPASSSRRSTASSTWSASSSSPRRCSARSCRSFPTTCGRLMQMLDEVVHHTRELKDSVMSMRAQPVGAVFQRMPRLVRELAAKTGKKVRLEPRREHRGRPFDHRAADRSAHPHHPQLGRPRNRNAGGARSRGQARGRNHPPVGRASRRPDRHRGPRRRRGHQPRAGAAEGAREGAGRARTPR